MLYYATWQIGTSVLEECAASLFRVCKQHISLQHWFLSIKQHCHIPEDSKLCSHCCVNCRYLNESLLQFFIWASYELTVLNSHLMWMLYSVLQINYTFWVISVITIWLSKPRICGLIPGRDKDFAPLQSVQTDSGVHPASSSVGAGGDFLRCKTDAAWI